MVYDDEDVAVQNAAYNTTLTVTSSLLQNSGMCIQCMIYYKVMVYVDEDVAVQNLNVTVMQRITQI